MTDVIIPYHNNEATLKRLLDSIPEDMGIIIVDDASSTPLEGVRGTVYRFGENRGVSAARNWGLEMSEADYVVFTDADDVFTGLGDIQEPDTDVAVYGVEMVHGDGSPEVLPAALRMRVSAICCGILFRRKWLLDNNIRFLQGLEFLEDGVLIDTVRRMASIGQCSIKYGEQTLYRHIANPQSTTHTQPEHGTPQGILKDTLHAKSLEYEFLREKLPQCMGGKFRDADIGSLYYHYLTADFAGYAREDVERAVRILAEVYGSLEASGDIKARRRDEAAMMADCFTEMPYDEWIENAKQ